MKAGSFPISGLCFLIVFILVAVPPVNAYGVALGPTELQISDVLRGTSIERSVTLYNLGEAASSIDLTAQGDAAAWTRFYDGNVKGTPITSIDLKARENRPLIIQVSVPSDAANGIYNTTIHAVIKPPEATKSQLGVSAILEATMTLTMTVTGEQKMEGTVEYITVDDTEVNFPLPIRVLFKNSGNVAANPKITATISGKSGTIDTITDSGTQVNAGKSEPIVVRWTKTNIEPGNYSADIAVNLGESQIASKKVPFIIVPTGTLSRQGNLTSLAYTGDPIPGSILKITGTFENNGKIETKAKMVGEVYRDGTLVDSIASDELSVPINDHGELVYYLKGTTEGSYQVKAYVLYEGKKTEQKEISIKVSKTGGSANSPSGGKSPLLPGLAVLAIFGSLVLASFFRQDHH
jgi:hypothetical protein